MRKDVKPRWPIEKALFYGKEALKLAQQYKADIEPRLEAGALDGLASDLPRLDTLQSGRPVKNIEVQGLTGSQKDLALRGHAWIMAIRKAVKDRADGSGLVKATGVGVPVHAHQAASVATAIEVILASARERPAEMRACGVLDADLAKGEAILKSLSGARNVQDDGMGQKKDLTDVKNRTQRAVEKAILDISSSGNLHYHDTDPALAQRFLALIPPGGGNGGSAGDGGSGGTGGSGGGEAPPPPSPAKP